MTDILLYTGPDGSSDGRAAALFRTIAPEETLPVPTLADLISTVDHTPQAFGVLPLEDNVHGEYPGVFDRLILDTRRSIISETVVLAEPIQAYSVGTDGAIEVAFSHSSILELFADSLHALRIDARQSVTTWEACRVVAEARNPRFVAFAPPSVAERHGLTLHPLSQDCHFEIRTRFALLGHRITPLGSAAHTLVVILPGHDRPGTLAGILDAFARRGVNLVSLKSRDMGPGVPHWFLVELEGSPADEPIDAALAELIESGSALRLLGVLSVHDGVPLRSSVPPSEPFAHGSLDALRSFLADARPEPATLAAVGAAAAAAR